MSTDTPESLAAELDAMDAAPEGEAAAPDIGAGEATEADPAAVTPKAPDIDSLLEEAAAATSRAKERERLAGEKEKTANALHDKYKALDEAKTKGDIKSFVKLAKADGWTTQQIIEELALSEEFETGGAPTATTPAPTLEEQIAAAVAKALEDKETRTAEAKKTEKTADLEKTRDAFTNEAIASFKANRDKFPTVRAWAKKVNRELILQTFREAITANPDAPPPTPETIWEHLEAKFNGEIEAARPSQRTDVGARTTLDDVMAELEAEEAGAAPAKPTLMRKDPSIPIGKPVTPGNSNKTPLEEVWDELDRADREANGRLRY